MNRTEEEIERDLEEGEKDLPEIKPTDWLIVIAGMLIVYGEIWLIFWWERTHH